MGWEPLAASLAGSGEHWAACSPASVTEPPKDGKGGRARGKGREGKGGRVRETNGWHMYLPLCNYLLELHDLTGLQVWPADDGPPTVHLTLLHLLPQLFHHRFPLTHLLERSRKTHNPFHTPSLNHSPGVLLPSLSSISLFLPWVAPSLFVAQTAAQSSVASVHPAVPLSLPSPVTGRWQTEITKHYVKSSVACTDDGEVILVELNQELIMLWAPGSMLQLVKNKLIDTYKLYIDLFWTQEKCWYLRIVGDNDKYHFIDTGISDSLMSVFTAKGISIAMCYQDQISYRRKYCQGIKFGGLAVL